MDENKTKYIRISTIIIGILFLSLGTFEIYKIFSKTLVTTFSLSLPIYETGSFNFSIITLIIGYLSLNIGIFYKSFFKHLAKAIIGISVFFITTSFLLMAIDKQSEQIIDSIQPSIDILLVSSLDTIVDEMLTIKTGELIDIIVSENTSIQKFNNWEITPEHATYFMDMFQIKDVTDTKKLYLTRLLITMISDEIAKTPELTPNVAIPVNEIKTQIESSEIDLQVLKNIDEALMTQFYPVNINAYITLLISENDITKTILIGKSSTNEINEIWEQLGLETDISIETKTLVVDSLLTLIKSQLDTLSNSADIPSIPLATLKTLIPNEIFELLKYDLFHPNLQIRATELNEIRIECESKTYSESQDIVELNLKQLCENILYSKYDYFLTNIENLTKISNIELPQVYLDEIEKVNTIEKLDNTITTITTYKYLSIFIAMIILILSSALYVLHNRINKLELNQAQIVYDILKFNTINFCISFVFLILGYLMISSDKVFEIIKNNAPEQAISTINIFQTLPIFLELINILFQIILYSLRYLILLIILLLIFRKIDEKYFENKIEKF